MPVFNYARESAVAYARRWALERNPKYHNFVGQGGDCTNFVSQCIYAGACQMDYRRTFGWYYASVNNRSPAWTGVPFLYRYLTRGDGVRSLCLGGRTGRSAARDVIQLGRADGRYYHSCSSPNAVRRAIWWRPIRRRADRPLHSYSFARARYLHIDGVRADARPACK
jgi:hypothetical protein